MTLEINEIGIRMQVRDRAETEGAVAQSPHDDCGGDERASAERDDLVAECVRRVLRTLKTIRER